MSARLDIPSPDSTPRRVHGIDSGHMKRAALYARVSTDRQREEATIESQVLELKKQIAQSGNVLVKEYIDDGYSGKLLDRPALEELRDGKSGLKAIAEARATDLEATYSRLKKTLGDVKVKVTAYEPDLLGVYVLLPGGNA